MSISPLFRWPNSVNHYTRDFGDDNMNPDSRKLRDALKNATSGHQSSPSLIQKEKYTAALGWRHDPILESWSQLIKFDKGILT